MVVGALTVAPSIASAGDGFRLTSTTVYRFDPAATAVSVEATYEMTNTTRDRSLGGGRFEYFYFRGATVPIDAAATDLTVQVDGRDARYEVSTPDGLGVLDVSFGFDLRYDRTATIVVRYRLVGSAPRTDDSFVRINPAYVSFPVYAFADDGEASVRVEIPSAWKEDYVGGDLRYRRAGEVATFEALKIDDPLDFGVLFTARLDDALQSTSVAVGPAMFEIRAWPDDAEWAAFATRHISDGLPVLERLVGAPWPETNETDVIQASTPYLRGYAGFYFADTDVIEVGEQLDSHTMLHELSHAWFNDEHLAERWLSEGLADEIGARAAAELGDDLPSPDDYEAPFDAASVEPFPLNEWDELSNALDENAEYYGYRTSFDVMRGLYDEIGEPRMSELIAAIVRGERAYRGEGAAVNDSGAIDWREFLDLAEQVGGSTELVATYRELVVDDGELIRLDERDTALDAYTALEQRGGDWSAPAVVRSHMAAWQFDQADAAIDEADAVLDGRDELRDVLDPLDLAPSASLESVYQNATDLDATERELDAHVADAERLRVSRGELTEQLKAVGLDVPTLLQLDYDRTPDEVVATTATLAEQAADVATTRADIGADLTPYDVAVPPLPPDSFISSPDGTVQTVDAQQRAAGELVDAHEARADADSLLDQLGGLGTGVDADLDRAAERFTAGDTEGATGAARDARRALDEWTDRGLTRIGATAVIIAGAALLFAARRLSARRTPAFS